MSQPAQPSHQSVPLPTPPGASGTKLSRAERFRARFPQRYRVVTVADAAPAAQAADSDTPDSVAEVEAPATVNLHTAGRIIRLPELCKLVGLSRSAIYDRSRKLSPRYDASFPKRIHLGPRTVGWLEAEVMAWIKARAAARSDE